MHEQFGLDDYTYNLLIEYFKSQPEIKIVRIFGSRVWGTARKSSDIDFLIEGTYDDKESLPYFSDLNKLGFPYEVDVISITSEVEYVRLFVKRIFVESVEFYKRENYFPDEKPYISKVDNSELIVENKLKWQYRFKNGFERTYKEFIEQIDKEMYKINDILCQAKVVESFKAMYTGCWKTIKYYLYHKNIYKMMPRDIFQAAYEQKILDNIKIFDDVIFDFNILTNEQFINVKDEIFYRICTYYIKEFEKVYNYFLKLNNEADGLL